MSRVAATLISGISVALLACASAGPKLDATSVSQLRVGSTTKAQAQQLFGAPTDIELAPGRPEVWTYRTGGKKSGGVGLGDIVKSSPVKPPVSLPTGSKSGRSAESTLKLVFDERGVLEDYKFSQKGR